MPAPVLEICVTCSSISVLPSLSPTPLNAHLHHQHPATLPCRSYFHIDDPATELLGYLRHAAGLSYRGPASDILVWHEDGPNDDPAWLEWPEDWPQKTFAELGVEHGDVLVVQEHPNRLARNLRVAPEWLSRATEQDQSEVGSCAMV